MQNAILDRLGPDCSRTARGEHEATDSKYRSETSRQGGGDMEHRQLRILAQMHSPDHDGSRYTRDRDAPGQSCVYIPPGNHFHESYRLSTFSKYPRTVPISTNDLAQAGFYFTGYRDRAKCCSCGVGVENWTITDDAFDPQWHATDCLFLQGRENRNIPSLLSQFRLIRQRGLGQRSPVRGKNNLRNIGDGSIQTTSSAHGPSIAMDVADVTTNMRQFQLNENLPNLQLANIIDREHEALLMRLNLKNESDRRKTFAKWPIYPAPRLASNLAKDGFFYLGNLDRVQCFSCSGVLRNWAPNDDVRDQHQTHFRQCRFITGTDPRNVEMNAFQRQEVDEADRLRLSALLPSENTREPPDPSVAEQHHLALYFPCENPINRHMVSLQSRIDTFTRWPTNHTRATIEEIAKAGFFYLDESDKTKCFYCNGGLQNWDFHDEPWTEHAKWFPGCEYTLRRKGVEFVKRLADAHPNLNRPSIRSPMAFRSIPQFVADERPQSSQELNLNNGGQDLAPNYLDMAVGGIVRQVMEVPVNNKRHGEEHGNAPPKRRKSKDEVETGATLFNSLREIEKSLLCRMCRSNRAEAIVMPCAHLCACHDCVPKVKKCPICEHKVREFMKIFRA